MTAQPGLFLWELVEAGVNQRAVRGMPYLNAAIEDYVSTSDRAIPNFMITFAIADKGAARFNKSPLHILIKPRHAGSDISEFERTVENRPDRWAGGGLPLFDAHAILASPTAFHDLI